MNKTLIAMAVAGLMAAPMAAQADATIYGKLHTSIDFGDTGLDDQPTGEMGSSTYWQSNSSRLGFKGSEDLGGGLKGVWQLERTVSLGSGTSELTNRNSFLGLQGGWGRLIGGRHDTPFKTTGRKFDLFGDYVGDTRNLIQGISIGGNFDRRMDNALMYTTPVFGGGWDISAMYTLEDGNQDSEILSANINWKTGNWFLSLAYEDQGEGVNPAGATGSSGIRFGASWTPGAWKLNALYQTLSDVGGVSGNDGDAYGLGAGYKFGKNVIKAQYFVTSNEGSDSDASLMAIAWDYNFSKRTTGYLAYAGTSNDSGTYYTVDAGGHGSEIAEAALDIAAVLPGGLLDLGGKDPSAFSIGVIHKF